MVTAMEGVDVASVKELHDFVAVWLAAMNAGAGRSYGAG
jgi:hypothetical protein